MLLIIIGVYIVLETNLPNSETLGSVTRTTPPTFSMSSTAGILPLLLSVDGPRRQTTGLTSE